MRRLSLPAVLATVLVTGVVLASLSAWPPEVSASNLLRRFEFSEPHMGTTVRIVLYTGSAARAKAASRAAFQRVAALNGVLSDYVDSSELMRLAAQAGSGPVRVSDDLFTVLAAGDTLARRTHGAFDVTCGTVTRLWRRARRLSELPDASRVREARSACGYESMTLDASAHTVRLARAGTTLDVGGIAKGYAADEVLDVLRTHGVTRALVAMGGDIAVGDPPPYREHWSVDVAPVQTTAAGASLTGTAPGVPRVAPLALKRAAVSTSGDAEQWMTANGVRYSHILDLRTGWPMTIRSSTTVIAPRGLDADGIDTAVAVLGPVDGADLVQRTPGAAALWIREEANGTFGVYRSSRWPQS